MHNSINWRSPKKLNLKFQSQLPQQLFASITTVLFLSSEEQEMAFTTAQESDLDMRLSCQYFLEKVQWLIG